MKKGFTLIELLAVIVILAIIALIATPMILGVIETSKKGAFKNSLHGVLEAADLYAVTKGISFHGANLSDLPLKEGSLIRGKVFKDEDNGIYLSGVTDGEYCGNGYQNDLKITKGDCTMKSACFNFDKDNGIILGYDTSCGTDVVIPSTIEGVAVKEIGDSAFMYDRVKSLQISEGITKIGDSAFFNCGLTHISLPNTLTTIESSAFTANQLTVVALPENVVNLGSSVFSHNKIKAFAWNEVLSTISSSTFYNNELTEVTIPPSVTSIGNRAFEKNKIRSMEIPSWVTSVGIAILNDNQLPDDHAIIYARNSDGSEDKTSVVSYGGANRDHVVIPESVKRIEQFSFDGNALKAVTIPSNVTIIDLCAFYGNSLTSIELPPKLETIGKQAFDNNQLTTVTIPASVRILWSSAFNNNQLISVNIQGKASPSDFITYDNTKNDIWGWASGYSDANIRWNA